MPELPDVERFKRILERTALHRRIAGVVVSDARILQGLDPGEFAARLRGTRLESARRHGKHLLVRLAGRGWLTLHFGMTGDLEAFGDLADEPRFTRVRLDFEDGRHLAYVNRRMLGRVGLAANADAFLREEELGPDALDPAFDLAALATVLGRRRRDVKSVLMDQALLAGIGNIYADEILFQARIHPAARADALRPKQVRALHEAMRRVLAIAIERGAGAEAFLDQLPASFLLPHRDQGAACPRCGHPIGSMRSGGRSTYFCPHCQPAAAR